MKVIILNDYREDEWTSMNLYASHLHAALAHSFPMDRFRSFVAFPSVSKRFPKKHRFMRYSFRYIVNPFVAGRVPTDIYHITDQANAHLLRVLPGNKTIITCHDLIVPYWYQAHANDTQAFRWRIKRWRMESMRKASRIISVSEATKQALISTLGIDEDRITVIREGVDPIYFSPSLPTRISKILPTRYILHIGTNEKHKNIPWIFQYLQTQLRTQPNTYLVKIGATWGDDQLACMKRLGVTSRILHFGSISRSDLITVYKGAHALIQPSFIEGFGLTVLEAMASGCPVIISNTPALVELAGAVAPIIDPNEPPDSQKNRIALSSKRKKQTKQQDAISIARQYTWNDAAHRTHEIYAQLLGEYL